ncbi:MAG: SEC-C domain-containing protein [Planctomycetes bacterium]|nr:SEC-C domain-containing protein [Planctomycetota bacterium]
MGFLNSFFRPRPPEAARKLDRNDPCWCGSGKKYKKCHYEEDRKYFAQRESGVCRGPI